MTRIKWAIVVAVLASVAGTTAVAFAAMLNVDSDRVTVFTNTLYSPTITTTLSSSSITVGQSAHDSAALAGASTSPGGTVVYTIYGDDHCTAIIATAGTKPVSSGAVPDSDEITFTAAGTYYWHAAYSGDGNNQPAQSDCASEPFTVNKATPALITSPSGPSGAGVAITDTVTLDGGYNPTGTLSFNVYASADVNCLSALTLAPGGVTVSGNGSYTSGLFVTPAADTYHWIATYSGDPNNNVAVSTCH